MARPPVHGAAGNGGLHPHLSRIDRWGMAISSLCLIHCILLPVAIALLPAFASSLPGDAWVHPVLIGLALPVTGLALRRGYAAHRRLVPALSGGLGLALIGAALWFHGTVPETVLTVAGGLTVTLAHLMNWHSHHPHDDV